MKKNTFDIRVTIGGTMLILLLLANAVFTYSHVKSLSTDSEWVIHTYKVIDSINTIRLMVAFEESRQRGFIITGDPQYLQNYSAILSAFPQQFRILQNLVQDNPEQAARTAVLKSIVEQRLKTLNDNIELMKIKGLKITRGNMSTGLGRIEMGQLYAQSQAMIGAENKLLEMRTWRSQDVYNHTLLTILLANLFSLLVMAAFFHLLRLHLVSRTKSENLLFEERELFHITINSIGDGVVTTDTKGRVTFLNSVAQSLTGWTSEEAAGRPLDEIFRIVHEHSRQTVTNPIGEALQKNKIVRLANHTTLIAKNGKEISIEDSAAPINDKEGNIAGAVLVFRDITESNKSGEYRRRLAAIVDSSEDAIISKDLHSIITSWNRAAERLFGYSSQEMIGKSILILIPSHLQSEETEIIRKLQQGEAIEHFQTVRRCKDGTLIDISLTISPIKDVHGVVVGASKIARDITKQRRLEAALQDSEAGFRRLSEDLSKSNKELEQFAYVASHDLKEPLHTISSFVDLFIRRFGEKMEKKEREYLESIKQAALQGQILVRELLEFSRIGKNQVLEKVDLAQVIQKVKVNLNVLIKESDAQIEYVDLPLIKGTSMEMGQLFQNLIENSIKYRSAAAPRIRISASAAGNGMWLLALEDNGIGIDAAYRDRIFDIFERLHSKSESSGTGIGLAICKKIVTHYGGKIWVESEVGKGSIFYFTLPRAD